MIKKGMIFILVLVFGILALTACQGGGETAAVVETAAEMVADTAGMTTGETMSEVSVAGTTAATAETSAAEALAAIDQTQEVAVTVATDATAITDTSAVTIALNGDSIAADGVGVTVSGSIATITAAGTYAISGTLADGQIVVDTEDEAVVTLILNGVDISNATSAPIYVANAKAAMIVLADGSANNLVDGASYVFANPEEEEPSGAIFSNADLTITGGGSLTVTGNYNDAITSDDGLTIAGGAIAVSAVDDGLRGKDYLVIQGGTITVNAGGDGLKSDNEDDAALGYVAIEGGIINVTAAGDAIAAETNVLITGGEFDLVAGGGSGGQIEADASAKGIKGLANVLIDGGTFTVDSADDAIHSNANITINGGTFALTSGDDGIHADETITINGGDIRITESYEGIESAVITINAGDIHIVASDDGLNVAGGADGSGMMPGPGRGGRGQPGGMQGGDAFTYTGSYYLYIHGGNIVISAAGDGIDVNGAIEMTDGMVLVNGPTEQMNGALDYDATFAISGGTLVAAGSAGMAQAPSQPSSQNSVMINFSGSLPGGTLVSLVNEAGQSILTFAPGKEYQSVVFSSEDLVNGEYTLYYGGNSTGTAVDGLYQDGSYTPGTEYTSFTVSSATTILGGGGFR